MKTDTKGSKIVTVILLLICIALAAAVIYKTITGTETQVRATPPTSSTVANVYTEQIAETTFTKTIRIYGRVENNVEDVASVTQSTGYVTEILVKRGDEVKAGDIIGYTDSSTAGSSYKASPVTAKVDGTITSIEAAQGAYLQAGSSFAIITPEPEYYITLQIPEKYIFDVHVGTKATISSSIDSSLSLNAEVTYIDTRIDSATNTFSAELIPSSSEGLREGMTVTLDLVTKELEGVFTVPATSITAMNDGTYVYTVENNQAKLRKVTTTESNETKYLISEGLSAGDFVVTEGTVSDGTAVNVLTRGE